MILLSSFGTKGVVRRLKRKITGKTARAMLTWAHYTYSNRDSFLRVKSILGAMSLFAMKHTLPLEH
jgi:hypothetical protein